jgi:hemerythrin-like domain-containing protein
MPVSIAFWSAEHAGFSRLLDMLEKKLAAFHLSERPDYDLMLDIVHYLGHFPDRYHHPREDVAFACLVKRDAGLAPLVERLREEHALIAAAGNKLHGFLAEAAKGTLPARDGIEGTAQAYLTDYRRHIESEELTIMPRAVLMLTSADWKAVAQAIPAGIDPLFGAQADPAYHQLRRKIALQAA